MPTPSDATPVPEKSYAEMAQSAQAALDAENAAVQEQKDLHETVTQVFIPNKGVPPTSGDCVLDYEK